MKYRALIFAAFLPGLVQAQDMTAPSYLGVEWGTDEDGGSSLSADTDLTLPGNARLMLAASETRTPGDISDVTTRSWLVGFGSDPLAVFSAAVEVEHWGDEGAFVSDTWRLNLGLNGEYWSFHLRPQQSTHTLYVESSCTVCPSRVEVNGTAVAVDAAYYSDGPWSFNMGYMKHDYDRDVSVLAQHPRLMQLMFSPATLNLANGFQDYQVSLGLSYAESWGVLGYDWLKSVSKVDGAVTTMNSVSYSTSLSEQWRLRLHAGRQQNEDTGSSLVFGGAGLTYNW